MSELEVLKYRVEVATGQRPDPIRKDVDQSLVDLKFPNGLKWGDRVTLLWTLEPEEPDSEEHHIEDIGYVTAFPGKCEDCREPYLEAVVFIPEPYVEKEAPIPEWITVYDLIHNPHLLGIWRHE